MEAGPLLGEPQPFDDEHSVLSLDEAMHLPPVANDNSVSASSSFIAKPT